MISVILGLVSSRASHAKDKERTKKDNHAMADQAAGPNRLPAAAAQADVDGTFAAPCPERKIEQPDRNTRWTGIFPASSLTREQKQSEQWGTKT
jgi:hypothetical protein